MCIFHKWVVIKKGKAHGHSRFTGGWLDIIVTQEKCRKCGKERFMMKTLDGRYEEIDRDFVSDIPLSEVRS